jgi:hypothetical protein
VPVRVSRVSVCSELTVAQATQIDMIVGSVANCLNSSGGFCAGSHIVVNHQRINGTSFISPPRSQRFWKSPPPRASISFGTRCLFSGPRRTFGPSGPCWTALRRSCGDHYIPSHTTCSARAAVVRYRGRGTRVAGYRGRDARAGRVGHACALPSRAGACRGASEHPPRCHGCAVAQGV